MSNKVMKLLIYIQPIMILSCTCKYLVNKEDIKGSNANKCYDYIYTSQNDTSIIALWQIADVPCKPINGLHNVICNGLKKESYEVKNKKIEGLYNKYFPSGNIKSQVNYVNGIKNGRYARYYENGKQESIGSYLNGKESGIWLKYDSLGIVIDTLDYR